MSETLCTADVAQIVAERLDRPIVLVGLMGSGKSNIGRRLAQRLGLPFRDSDAEFETAAACTIAEYFAQYGEAQFREGERRVILRLLNGQRTVVATGGGAFCDPVTRAGIKEHAVSVWLRADLDLLVRRTSGRDHRPLLKQGDPREILGRLIEARHPFYAEADIVVDSTDESPDVTMGAVLTALARWLETKPQ